MDWETETYIFTMGETMTRKWGIVTAMAMVAITTLACGGDGDDIPPPAQPSPAMQKQTLMDNAHELGETLFLYDVEQLTQYALYYGNEHIVFLKSGILRGVKLTSNECINLSVRKKHDNGDWGIVYSFQNLSPGDYVLFNGSWRVTSYTP